MNNIQIEKVDVQTRGTFVRYTTTVITVLSDRVPNDVEITNINAAMKAIMNGHPVVILDGSSPTIVNFCHNKHSVLNGETIPKSEHEEKMKKKEAENFRLREELKKFQCAIDTHDEALANLFNLSTRGKEVNEACERFRNRSMR